MLCPSTPQALQTIVTDEKIAEHPSQKLDAANKGEGRRMVKIQNTKYEIRKVSVKLHFIENRKMKCPQTYKLLL